MRCGVAMRQDRAIAVALLSSHDHRRRDQYQNAIELSTAYSNARRIASAPAGRCVAARASAACRPARNRRRFRAARRPSRSDSDIGRRYRPSQTDVDVRIQKSESPVGAGHARSRCPGFQDNPGSRTVRSSRIRRSGRIHWRRAELRANSIIAIASNFALRLTDSLSVQHLAASRNHLFQFVSS
jgi:hypothetical protein